MPAIISGVRCVYCGDVEVLDSELTTIESPTASWYTFRCPCCNEFQQRRANTTLLRLLAGTKVNAIRDPDLDRTVELTDPVRSDADGFTREGMLRLLADIAALPDLPTAADLDSAFLAEPCRPVSPFDRGWRAWVRRDLGLDGAA